MPARATALQGSCRRRGTPAALSAPRASTCPRGFQIAAKGHERKDGESGARGARGGVDEHREQGHQAR